MRVRDGRPGPCECETVSRGHVRARRTLRFRFRQRRTSRPALRHSALKPTVFPRPRPTSGSKWLKVAGFSESGGLAKSPAMRTFEEPNDRRTPFLAGSLCSACDHRTTGLGESGDLVGISAECWLSAPQGHRQISLRQSDPRERRPRSPAPCERSPERAKRSGASLCAALSGLVIQAGLDSQGVALVWYVGAPAERKKGIRMGRGSQRAPHTRDMPVI